MVALVVHLVLAVQADVLVRSLAIAVVLVSPYGYLKWRQVRAVRAERVAAESAARHDAEPTPARPTLEDVVDTINALADAPTGDGEGSATATVVVPHDVTVAGDDPPPGLVDTLVRDALRRSGWIPTSEVDTSAGRVIEVRRRTGEG